MGLHCVGWCLFSCPASLLLWDESLSLDLSRNGKAKNEERKGKASGKKCLMKWFDKGQTGLQAEQKFALVE